jgi:Tfp pilus assembly pilus retraction ATPase PilT
MTLARRFMIIDRMTPTLEIMINTPSVKKLIEEKRLDKLAAAIETGTEDGLLNFNQALYNIGGQKFRFRPLARSSSHARE